MISRSSPVRSVAGRKLLDQTGLDEPRTQLHKVDPLTFLRVLEHPQSYLNSCHQEVPSLNGKSYFWE